MFPFPKLWGCKYTDKILIINNFMNIFESGRVNEQVQHGTKL